MSNHLICPYCEIYQDEKDFIYWLTLTSEGEIDEPYLCEHCHKELDYEIVLHKKTEN